MQTKWKVPSRRREPEARGGGRGGWNKERTEMRGGIEHSSTGGTCHRKPGPGGAGGKHSLISSEKAPKRRACSTVLP